MHLFPRPEPRGSATLCQIPVGGFGFAALLCLCAWLLLGDKPAQAAIFSCPGADGGMVFQDRPCDKAKPTPPKERVQPAATPLKMHESWFVMPDYTNDRAWCNRSFCECGRQERRLGSQTQQAVNDALYIDGSWHRYDQNLRAWQDAPTGTTESLQSRLLMEEAACDVMLAQEILRKHAPRVLRSLRQLSRDAENLVYDDPEQCSDADPEACRYLKAVSEYRRMLVDVKSLAQPRFIVED